MAFSYSGDPSQSDVDRIRFALGDTSPDNVILQDEEIQYIVDNNSSTTKQLVVAFRHAATKLSARPAKRSLGPQSEDNTSRNDYFISMANKLERTSIRSGVPNEHTYDSDQIFGKGMMSNV